MKPTDLFDLLRIPNVTTAVSDVLAAGLLAGATQAGDGAQAARWGAAMLASACLYCAGMVWNDAADATRDARERPERPIPSGRIRRRFAVGLGAALAASGWVAAAFAGRGPLLCSLALAAAILVYNLRLSGRPLVGPLGMATCRGLNLVMGVLACGPLGAPAGWAAALLALYVFGVTHLSLGETGGGARRSVAVAAALAIGAGAGAAALGWFAGGARSALGMCAVLLPLVVLALRVGPPLRRAWLEPIPRWVGPAVGSMVSGILWFDAALAMGHGPPVWLLPFVVLAVLQAWLRRRFPVT